MTEKIKLTQAQADGIERYKQEMVKSLKMQFKNGFEKTPYEWAKPLVELGAEQILDAVQHGYEVKPKFKVGDLVHVSGQKGLYEITYLSEYYADLKGLWGSRQIKNLRHATAEEIAQEKERRKWAAIEPGDVVISQISGAIGIFEAVSDCYREVKVKKHNGAHQLWWNENNIELYAKKVGDE